MKSFSARPCTFCGNSHSDNHAGGEWHCPEAVTVSCCHTCAVTVLPILIADSLHIFPAVQDPKRLLVPVEAGLWKGLATRAMSSRGVANKGQGQA